jgi:competence protein ComEC
VILLLQPEEVIDPSFQMSFAAIVGLIALAEWQMRLADGGTPMPTGIFRILRWLRRYVVGLILASVVAGLATAPFAIFHFDRAPGYSLLANLLATPVVGIVIMPAACLTVVAMPLGLERGPLQIMGWGVRTMTDIAHWVAELPGAVNLLPAWSPLVLFLIVGGGLWTGLWQRRWRWLGLAPALAGLLLSTTGKPPDIVVARDGGSAAVRSADGKLVFLGNPDAYTAAQWLLRDGDARDPAAAKAGAACDEWGCIAHAADGRIVALSLRAGALADDCARASIVVSTVPVRRACNGPARVIDRFATLRDGAAALRLSGDAIRVETVRAWRGERPWAAKKIHIAAAKSNTQ